jgi:hypothetical protein
MGKWASASKKGSQGSFGYVSAPPITGFTLTVNSPTAENITRNVNIPAPATMWGVRVIHVATGSVAYEFSGGGSTFVATGLTTGELYRVYAAWFLGTVRVSEFAPVGSFSAGS